MIFSDKQIKDYKAQHGVDLHLVEVIDGDKTYSCILRAPSRKDISYAAVAKDPISISEVMLRNLWVAGDEEIKERDDLFLAVLPKLEVLLQTKEATIKKL